MPPTCCGRTRPVVTATSDRESRFGVLPKGLVDHGVVSAMGVVIRAAPAPGAPSALHTTRARSFSPDEVGFLQSVANVLALAIERSDVDIARQRETETLQAIFDNIPVMISVYDESGHLLRVNREWERTLGWTLEEAQKVDILAETYPDPERRREVLAVHASTPSATGATSSRAPGTGGSSTSPGRASRSPTAPVSGSASTSPSASGRKRRWPSRGAVRQAVPDQPGGLECRPSPRADDHRRERAGSRLFGCRRER